MFAHLSSELKQDIPVRLQRLQKRMAEQRLDALLITSIPNLIYATGTFVDGYLYLPQEGDAVLFIRRPKTFTGDRVVPIRKPEDIPARLADYAIAAPSTIGLEDDEISAAEWLRLTAAFPQACIQPAGMLIKKGRAIKTPFEQALCRDTCAAHARLFNDVPTLYRPGMTELEWVVEIENLFRRNGHLGIFRTAGFRLEAFLGTVLSGDNAEAPSPYDFALGGAGQDASFPVGMTGGPLQNGQSTLVDYSFNRHGYLSDLSRVYANGALPETASICHQIALDIQDAVLTLAKPGIPCNKIWELAEQMVARNGMQEFFMGHRQQAKFIGHGVGLQINEPPVFTPRDTTLLEEGMVMALEPKFTLPGVGAVGVENTFLMTENGFEKLTAACPDTITPLPA